MKKLVLIALLSTIISNAWSAATQPVLTIANESDYALEVWYNGQPMKLTPKGTGAKSKMEFDQFQPRGMLFQITEDTGRAPSWL